VRVTKIWVVLTGVTAAAALAGCSSGASDANAAANAPTSSGSAAAPTTTTAPPSPSTTAPPSTSTTTKKPAVTAKTATSKPAANPAVPCSVTDGACVDLSAKKAWLLSGGMVIYGPVPIEPGRKGYATPTGMFHVLYKEKMHYSKEFDNAPMPNSVFFYPGDAFHTGSLSTPSHGCVHLSSASSLKFFNTLQVGQPVQIVPRAG
jgi:lipoprotein-anchoring transpeptidase ErfK/SrfK